MKARLILVETFVDGRQNLLMLTPNTVINAQTHATYTIIDSQTRKTPVDLVLHRQGDALQVMMGDEPVVTLEGFYNEALASQYISANDVLLISDDVLINATDTSLAGLSSGDALPAYYDTLVAMTMYGITAASVYKYEKNQNDDEVTIIPPSTTIYITGISDDTGVSTADFITNTAAQTITATLSAVLETGEILNGSIDGGITWIDITGKVSGTAISWDGVVLSGSSSIQIKVTDSGGHDGAVASQAYVLDMIAPVVTVSGIDISADTGTSASDFLTKTAAQTITATLTSPLGADELVWGSVDGGSTWIDITNKVLGTAITWTGAILSGSSSIQIKVTDIAGNDGAITTQSYVLDTTIPATTISAIDISDDTGTSAADFITQTAAQTITATLSTSLVAGEILYGSVDGGTTWIDITSKVTGTAISWDGVTLAGNSAIQIKVTDLEGSDGVIASQAYVLDTIPPVKTISGIDISGDSGSSATDFLTKTAVQTITGTLSAVLTTGEILYGSVDGGFSWTDITSKVTGTAISWDAAVLAGSSSINMKVTDAAGNDGAIASQAYVLDTTAPTTTISAIDISVDTGTTATDFITQTAAQTVSATLSASLVAGEILYGSVDGGATWTDITSKVTGTAISWNAVTLSGSSSIQFKVTDAADNDGAIASQAYVLDTTASTTTISAIDISADTGTTAADFITQTAAQTITATLSTSLVAGEILYGSVDGGSIWTNITSKVTGTAISWNAATLSGSSSIQFKVTDAAGNDGAVASQAYVLDITAPSRTISAIDISADTGTLATDFLTKTSAQTITATLSTALAASEILYGSVDGGATWTDITSKASGTAIIWNSTTLSGSSSIQFKVTDAAGNDGAIASQAYVLDTTASTTTINTIDISADTGTTAADFITQTAAQTITATLSTSLVAGEILYGSVDGGSTWIDITSKATGTAISWNAVTLSGSSSIQFKVSDAAGNDGAIASQAYVLDTTIPSNTINNIDISADTGTLSTDFNTRTAAQTITATLSASLVAGDVLWGSVDNGSSWSDITSKASGTAISWNGAVLSGTSAIKMKVTDAAGNDGAVASQAYVLDVTSPTTTISSIDISADTGTTDTDFTTKTAAQTITGTLSASLVAGEILYGSVNGGTTWIDITNKATGTTISWNAATLSGSSSIQFKVTDAAGNDGAIASQAYVLDTTASTTTISAIDISDDTGTLNSDFITNVDLQTITATLSASLVAGEILYGSLDAGSTWTNITSKVTGAAISWDGVSLSGVSSIQFKVTDAAGNDGAIASQDYVLDVTESSTVISAIDISADTGKLATDFITKTSAQTITATLSTDLDVDDVLWGSVDAGVTWVDITGKAIGTTITWDGATLSGSSSIQMKIIDAAGNEGVVASQAYVLDGSAPATLVSGIDISADTGTLADDFLTKTASQTITATLDNALVAGEVLWGSVNSGTTWIDITNKVSGTAITWNGAVLSGSSAIQIKVSDLAGNDSTTASQAYVLDVTAPLKTISSIDISADSGALATDFITKTASQTITGTLNTSLVAGEILYGSVDGGSTWIDITSKAAGTAISWDGASLSGSSSIKIKVTDAAGNDGTSATQAYLLDTTSPTTTITSAAYDNSSNTLTLTGTNMTTLLTGSEGPASDLKANMDWSKLQWDIDSDNTGNITFTESDITNARVTNGTTLTIVLGNAKAAALEATGGFDSLTINDSLDITTGFTRDTAGNVSTTDRLNTPDPTVVVFDLVAGQSSSHSGRTFDAGTSYDIYIMVDSNSRALVSATQWSGVSSLGPDDNITLVGNGSAILGQNGNPVTGSDNSGYIFWNTVSMGMGGAASLTWSGLLWRKSTGGPSVAVDLWTGSWSLASPPLAGGYLNTLPAGIYTTQGL